MKNFLIFLMVNCIAIHFCTRLNSKSFYSEYINPEVIDEIRKVFSQ